MNVRANINADFPAKRELVLERIFDAPREKVYRAWTEPKLLKQWFAPQAVDDPGRGARRQARRLEHDCDARPRRQGLSEPGHLPGGGREREARLHGCLHRGLGAVRKAIHARPSSPSRIWATARRATRRASATGRSKTAKSTRRWVSTRLGPMRRPARGTLEDDLTTRRNDRWPPKRPRQFPA